MRQPNTAATIIVEKTARSFNVKYVTVFSLIDMVDKENAKNKHELMKASTRSFRAR